MKPTQADVLFSAYRGLVSLKVKWLKRDPKYSVPSVPRLIMCVAKPSLPQRAQGLLYLS